MIKRLQAARHKLLALLKWCLSFFKAEWSLSDYPIIIHKHDQHDPANRASSRKAALYTAQIVNWWLVGSGDTAHEAFVDLERNFATQKANNRDKQQLLPRPGTHVAIQFSARDRVDAHAELAEDFITRVLGLEWAWISDGSSLWDFHEEETNDTLVAKTGELYGVDISDIQSGKLCEIFERIAREDKFQRWR